MSYAPSPPASTQTRENSAPANKIPISIRLDADILQHFKERGSYQSQINRVLRRHVERQKRKQVAAP